MNVLMPWDHLLVALLLLVVPFWGRASYRRLARRLAAGEPDARRQAYLETIAQQSAACVIVLLTSWLGSRPLAVLGLVLPVDSRTAFSALFAAAALGLLAFQWRAIGRLDGQGLEPIRRQLASASALVPRTEAEHRAFRFVALTAGIVEELVYRGYLIGYGAVLVGTWPAVFAAGLAFGLGHFYQGRAGVIKTALVGIAAGVLYVATGSLLWPIVLHVAVDLQGGAVGRRALGAAPA